jgi:hypothetical protein
MMSDDYRSFEEMVPDALQVNDFMDKPDIDQYLTDYEPEWLDVWEAAPVEDMTAGQIEALIDMVLDNDFSEYSWEEMIADMMSDFWDWYNENYGTN